MSKGSFVICEFILFFFFFANIGRGRGTAWFGLLNIIAARWKSACVWYKKFG